MIYNILKIITKNIHDMLIYSLCLTQLIIWIQTWMLAKKLNYGKSLHING